MIIHGISVNEDEEGPERYRLITEVIARTIYASSYEEQIQIARKIPIKKTYRLGRYNSQRGRPIVINFVYHEDCEKPTLEQEISPTRYICRQAIQSRHRKQEKDTVTYLQDSYQSPLI